MTSKDFAEITQQISINLKPFIRRVVQEEVNGRLHIVAMDLLHTKAGDILRTGCS